MLDASSEAVMLHADKQLAGGEAQSTSLVHNWFVTQAKRPWFNFIELTTWITSLATTLVQV
ncbi:hypothetical protein O9929_10105 [Vibrio lentus]|nr:hypothetical protein [Vibrio lentus]